MKKIYIIASIVAATLSFTGCYDLDRVPADQMSADNFNKNEEQIKATMMAVYSKMQNENVFGLQFAMDGLGGIAMGYDNPSFQIFQRGNYDVKNGKIYDKWKNLYEGIARANGVLQNVDKAEMPDEIKSRYKGEAKFMRALYYFTLMDFFGGVPIYDESVISAKATTICSIRATLPTRCAILY